MARPTRFRPQMVPKIQQLLLLGLSNGQAAEALGIGERTLMDWRTRIPAVAAVFASSRELALAGVAKNLFRRANGFRVRTEKVFQHQGEVVRAKTTEYYPPDVRAAEIILKARAPQLWPPDRGVQVGVQVVAGLPDTTLEGLQRLARQSAGLALPAGGSGQRTIETNTPTAAQEPNPDAGNGS